MKFPNDYVIGVFIPEGTKKIDIIGTTVIPEFGVLPILNLGITLFGITYLIKKPLFGANLTRIN